MTTPTRGRGRPPRTDTVRKSMQVPQQFRDYVRELAAHHGVSQMDAILYHLMPMLDPDRVPAPAEVADVFPELDGDDLFL